MNAHPVNPPKTGSRDSNGFNEFKPFIETALDSACQFAPGCPARLAEAMRYAVLAPGKRLRPALAMMAAEACGADPLDAIPGAVAVEMIHAYSLIHDDLPAMDDDDLRRGRPTCHIKFDEATAILAGDALIAEAFSHLSDKIKNPELAIEAIRTLGHAAGSSRLVGGQMEDLAAENRFSSEKNAEEESQCKQRAQEHLESIHQRKTGALIAASLDLGALLGGGSKIERDALAKYAKSVGLAFQVVDDLLDFTSDAKLLGKRTGKDAAKGKLTYPSLLGIDGAKKHAEALIQTAQEAISVFGERKSRLSWAADYVLERQH